MTCIACLEKRADLISKAIARLGDHPSQAKADALTTEIIEGRPRRYCEGCGRRIPQYHSMQYSGFRSQSVHHFHTQEEYITQSADGGDGRRVVSGHQADRTFEFSDSIHFEFCHECYLADYAKVYPNAPAPQIANADFT